MSWYPLQSSHSRSWVTVGKKRRTQTPLHADFKLGLQVYLLTTSHKCFSMQATVVVAWASVTTLLNKQLVVKTTTAVVIYDLHGQRKFQLHVQYVCTILMAKFRSHVLYVYSRKTNYTLGLCKIISLSNVAGDMDWWCKCIPASNIQIHYKQKTHVNIRCKCHSYLFKETLKMVNNKLGLVKKQVIIPAAVKQLQLT